MRLAALGGWWCAIALLGLGCSLPRGVTATRDGGVAPIDAYVQGRDAAPPPDADVDAFVPPRDDSGLDAYVPPVDAYVPPVDAYVPPVDAYAPPDAWVEPIDAWVPPGDASSPCDILYGGVPGYVSCAAFSTVDGCTFFVNWPGASRDTCATACGSRCVGAIGNVDGTSCSMTGASFPCDQQFQDAICTCRP